MVKIKSSYSAAGGLKYKLRLAFCLMSILPLLVCIAVVVNYIWAPQTGISINIPLAIAVSIVIAIIGFLLTKEMIDRIVSVSVEVKRIASGDVSRKISPLGREDEVAELSDALNQLTHRMRQNMEELKSYSEKTTEINIEIQKRVLVLSSLMQISSLISQGEKLDDIFRVAIEKSLLLAGSESAFLMLKEDERDAFYTKTAEGINSKDLMQLWLDPQDSLCNYFIKARKPLISDAKNPLPQSLAQVFTEKFKLKNALVCPVYLKGAVRAIFGIGSNKENFSYKKDDIELLDIFSKQIAIAIENDVLTQQLGKLEIKDALTGLYNERFMRSRLQEEIKRAITYQRPCAFILLNVDSFYNYHVKFGSLEAEATLKKIAVLIKDSVSEIDKVGRVGDNEFAVVLPEKNKRNAKAIADGIRKKIEFSFSEEEDTNKQLTLSGAVSENPLDGIEAEELITKAKESLKLAKMQGKNRIIG